MTTRKDRPRNGQETERKTQLTELSGNILVHPEIRIKRSFATTQTNTTATMSKTPRSIMQHSAGNILASSISTANSAHMDMLLLPIPVASSYALSSNENEGTNHSFLSRVQWKGTNPLEWIESLAAEAEARETAANGGKPVVPIRVNNVNLSLKLPVQPKLVSMPKNHNRNAMTPTENANEVADCYGLKDDYQRKRVRIVGTSNGGPNSSGGPQPENISWHLSSILKSTNGTSVHPSVLRMEGLISRVESLGGSPVTVKSSYKRIRDHFMVSCERIMARCMSSSQKMTDQAILLEVLCTDTIQKLEALLSMAAKLEPNCARVAVASLALKSPAVTSSGTGTTPHQKIPTSATESKRVLAKYMTAWLRNNWANPYPDDNGLEEMAEACNTTTAVVSNWLINARTRKWRPAIVKAFNMNRPSEVLLEDSLNFFDGNPLRSLAGEPATPQVFDCRTGTGYANELQSYKRAKKDHDV